MCIRDNEKEETVYHEHVAKLMSDARHRGALIIAIKFAIRNNLPAAYKRASDELRAGGRSQL